MKQELTENGINLTQPQQNSTKIQTTTSKRLYIMYNQLKKPQKNLHQKQNGSKYFKMKSLNQMTGKTSTKAYMQLQLTQH